MSIGATYADDVAWRIESVLFHAPQDGRLKLGVVNITRFDLRGRGRTSQEKVKGR